jgi:carboxyl-terminal processing protease
MRMKPETTRNILLGSTIAIIGVLLVIVGFLARVATEPDETIVQQSPVDNGGGVAADAGDRTGPDFELLDEIVDILDQDFVEPDRIDADYLYSGAIQGIFNALDDPHSTYIGPDDYALSRDDFEGTFQGIGATVAQQDDTVVIVRPLPDTPAESAGILAGDVILAVDGDSAIGWSVQQAVLRIRGPEGTEVTLEVRHANGDEETIVIVRDDILVSSVSLDPPGGVLRDGDGELVSDIGYMWIRQFTRQTPQEVQDALDELDDGSISSLIIDVRSNPGGLLDTTIQVADMFLDEGNSILFQVDRDGNELTSTSRPGQATELPVVLLQDQFSASGAELLAAALQENGRAVVIGTTSFGKGTVNHVRELSNGGAVYVSIARWLTPDRNLIEGIGIIPDIEVELTIEDIEANRDVVLLRAIDYLRNS